MVGLSVFCQCWFLIQLTVLHSSRALLPPQKTEPGGELCIIHLFSPTNFRWAPVQGNCPSGTRFTGTHCEQMVLCQPAAEARQPRWCELPPFSFCGSWRQTRQEEESVCCLSSKLDPGSQTGQQASHIIEQAEDSKPNTEKNIEPEVQPEVQPESVPEDGPKSEPESGASTEPTPEPETEPNSDNEFDPANSPALGQKAETDNITTVGSIFGQATEASNIFEDTEAKLATNLRPHRNLKNFKISVEMSEKNKVVFKVPKEEEDNDIAQEINEVFSTLPEMNDEILLEINEDKTEADVNSLTVKNLQELEALVIRNVKNIILTQQDTQPRRLK